MKHKILVMLLIATMVAGMLTGCAGTTPNNNGEGQVTEKASVDSATVKPGLAALESELHRPVPTEFRKSSALDDLIYYENLSSEESAALHSKLKEDATVVCTPSQFIGGLLPLKSEDAGYGSYKVVSAEGQNFDKALQITCTSVPVKDSNFIVYTSATPEVKKGSGITATEIMLLSFSARCISGGDENGNGMIKVQIQHPETYKKSIFKEVEITGEWQTFYLPFYGIEDATDVGVRAGYYEQVV